MPRCVPIWRCASGVGSRAGVSGTPIDPSQDIAIAGSLTSRSTDAFRWSLKRCAIFWSVLPDFISLPLFACVERAIVLNDLDFNA